MPGAQMVKKMIQRQEKGYSYVLALFHLADLRDLVMSRGADHVVRLDSVLARAFSKPRVSAPGKASAISPLAKRVSTSGWT